MTDLGPPRPPRDARERVVDVLSRNFAEDRLSMQEFELRVKLAYDAPTSAELERLVSDLPASLPTRVAAAIATVAPRTSEKISALFSSNSGSRLTVPQQLEITAHLGSVELDLSAAAFPEGATDINVSAVMGSVELSVPGHVRVECAVQTILASCEVDADHASLLVAQSNARSLLRVTGYAALASVKITVVPEYSR